MQLISFYEISTIENPFEVRYEYGTCYSYIMGMSGLSDMYTRIGPRALGVHIRQTMNAHVITVMYHIAPPLTNWKQLKPGNMQVCKPIVFIGKVVGIDFGFSLIGNFQCITFIQ